MTKPTEPTDAPMLPGLEPPAERESALELAARRTLAELERLGLLEERHAVLCQLVLELSAAVAAGRKGGRASAAAMAAAQLLAAVDQLPTPVERGDGDDAWTQLAADLRAAADRAAAADH